MSEDVAVNEEEQNEEEVEGPVAEEVKKGFDLSDYGLDAEKIDKGVWIDWNDSGCKLLIAGAKNTRYEKLVRKRGKSAAMRSQRTGDQEPLLAIARRCASEAILLDWKSVMDGGVELPYTNVNARKMFDKYEEFFEDVMAYSRDISYYKKERDDEDQGN